MEWIYDIYALTIKSCFYLWGIGYFVQASKRCILISLHSNPLSTIHLKHLSVLLIYLIQFKMHARVFKWVGAFQNAAINLIGATLCQTFFLGDDDLIKLM